MTKCGVARVLLLLAGLLAMSFVGRAEDWPTFLHDAARSGVTDDSPGISLYEQWVFEPLQPPRPAWPEPARQDFWHEIPELSPVVTYDRAFHAVIAGDRVFFGSSATDQVYCLNADTGDVLWTFFAEGPVRLAPAIADGKVYFGSDDGCMYCLDVSDGRLLWKRHPAKIVRRIPGNGRIMDLTPIRTGVVVDNGLAYCCAGLFPLQGVYCCAFDAISGTPIWRERASSVSPQGYLCASRTRLIAPTGRTAPALFDRANGKFLQQFEGGGGAFAVLVDDRVASGPGRPSGNTLDLAAEGTQETIAAFDGVRMVVKGNTAYLQSKTDLAALDREPYVVLFGERQALEQRRGDLSDGFEKAKAAGDTETMNRLDGEIQALTSQIDDRAARMASCYRWRVPNEHPYALILAGDVLYAGGDQEVAAFDVRDGTRLWAAPIPGRGYGLSAANGALYVSTGTGSIHCFRARPAGARRVVAAVATQAPFPEDDHSIEFARSAESILNESGITKGYCVVLGCREGRLAWELARRSELSIVGVVEEAGAAASIRARLAPSGLYGSRIVIHEWSGPVLPYTTYFADLIVSEETLMSGGLPEPASEAGRILRPYGGTICLGGAGVSRADLDRWLSETSVPGTVEDREGVWAVARRGPVEGAGEWTQLYANASQMSCSMDALRGPMTIQWFGEPGPRDIVDRHHRPMASLFKDGRLYVPGNDVLMAVDAYNGTLLWRIETPNARRVGALKNSGHVMIVDDSIYIAIQDACWVVNAASGERVATFPVPRPDDTPRDWGYLNADGDCLVGTAQKSGASFSTLSKMTVNMIEGDFRPVVVSECLFCVDRKSGEPRWTYRNGAIMNNAVTLGDGRVFFVESRNARAKEASNGRLRVDWFCESDAFLEALDLKSGEPIWEMPVRLPFHHIMYMNGSEGVLIVSGSFNQGSEVRYGMQAFDMATGATVWENGFRALDVQGKDFAQQDGSHGEQWQRPVIVGQTVYLRPFAFDLKTGEKKDFIARRGGHGCGGLTASRDYLFGRGSNPRMYPLDVKETSGEPLTLVNRPGCWLNIIPAGGLVMIPESSSGCTCAYPLQTSLALAPAALAGGVASTAE